MQASQLTVRNQLTTQQAEPGQKQLESLLAVDANWYGSPAFAYKGAVPELPAHLRDLAKRELADIELELETIAPDQEVSALLYTLQGHYWQPGMSEALMKQVASDYIRLLGGYPVAIFRRARDAWLLNPDNRYFPKVGEIKQLLDAQLAAKKWRKQQCGGVCEIGPKTHPREFWPLSRKNTPECQGDASDRA